MGKRLSYLMVLVCAFVMMIASAQAGESYRYITSSDGVTSGTTRTTNATMVQHAADTLEEYPDMEEYSQRYLIPGLRYTLTYNSGATAKRFVTVAERFAPQGICISGKYLLITAWDFNESYNSVIYVLSAVDNSFITTIVLPDVAHVGGIAYDTKNGYIWVCNEYEDGTGKVSGFTDDLLNESVSGINSSSTTRYGIYLKDFAKEYDVLTDQASYCTYYDGLLWVGQFEEDSVADIYGYTVDLSKSALTAKYIMEAPAKTQGIAFYKSGSTVYLIASASYGRSSDSEIIIYKPSYSTPQTVSGKSYKRILKNNRVTDYTFSPLTEGVAVQGNTIYILLESGAYKYLKPENSWQNTWPFDQYLLFDASKLLGI